MHEIKVKNSVSDVIENKRTNVIYLKKIRFCNCVLIYLKNATGKIQQNGEISKIIPMNSFIYIEKNSSLSVKLNNTGGTVSYEIYHIDSGMLKNVYKVIKPLFDEVKSYPACAQKIFIHEAQQVEIDVFKLLVSSKDSNIRQIYKVAYILSKFPNIDKLMLSIEKSIKISFTEKVKNIIETDMSKQWRLCHLSDKLFMSEVNIRKKLEKENITFNNLLLDLRMNFSARLLNTTEMHVSNIAKKSGYSNVSYFIKVFKDYFGVTPRQYNLKIRGRTMCP
ncbi:helix-turn-helix domain-containing protein [Escherichia coli]|nr:helix-turn-helix domain-containing protein [Escherichia coli]MDU3761967.1 helix-turn-helix domain-containing protein [Bacteroides sp.]EFI4242944.1 helix-turn-helix domain-containing protein [Escherichia coli]MCH6951371.1 hypothetical protein [Escherichia coli]OWD65283.1 hypothetical protein A8C71_20285 [Escherichia coli]